MRSPSSGSARYVLTLAGTTACLIEPTPGFGDTATTTSGDPSTTSASTTFDDGMTSRADTSDGSSTGDDPMPLPIPARGYEERPCGFDVDRDGIVGEPAAPDQIDECEFCDGSTPDPDGDGFAQPMLYVNCDGGTDPDIGVANACRDPAAPCATIDRAMREVPYGSGPSDGQGVICFRGTCNEAIEVRSGRPEVAVRPPSGIEVRAFDYPATPSMVIGWDYDDDREYPPYDDDDLAELVPPSDATGALRFDLGSYNTPTHDIEYAHFVVSVAVGPGVQSQSTSLVQTALSVSDPHERIHFHDLSVRSLQQGHGPGAMPLMHLDMDGYTGEDPETESSRFNYLALENLEILAHGAFVFADHADIEADVSGPIRLANLTTHALACDKSVCTTDATASVWRMGGWVQEIEILASIFDAGTDDWYPHEGTDPLDDAGPTAIVVGECTRDIAILQNEFIGWSTAVRVEGNGSATAQGREDTRPCDGRDVDGVRIEGNLVRDSNDRLIGTTVPFVLQTAHPDAAMVGDDRTIASVRIVNNVVVADHGLTGCAWTQLWGATAGPVEIAHDTCIGAIQTQVPAPGAALVRVLAPRTGAIDPLEGLAVRGQLFAGQSAGDVAIALESVPASWVADHNAFSPEAAFRWQTDPATDLTDWRNVSGHDAVSRTCTPEFFALGDFHLATDDMCAGDLAVPIDGIDYDIDGDPRPDTEAWDAGADERP